MLVTNDPWMTAGQINDLTVVTPVFRGERMIGLFASTCHAPDIGGRLLSAEAADVYEEGLRLPIMKLARAGTMNEDLLALIRANVRTPRETVGDLYAQTAANDVGARSLLRCLDDLDLEDLETVGAEIRRRSEIAMREAISKLPDGRYEAIGYSDGHGERDRHCSSPRSSTATRSRSTSRAPRRRASTASTSSSTTRTRTRRSP